MFALVDVNAFYASCETVFRPDLQGKPVVVLSNNDGCVIALSAEAKKLGIMMGAPFFKQRDLFRAHRVTCFSSNYELYADMSRRVMGTLEMLCPRVDVYSQTQTQIEVSRVLRAAWMEDRTLRTRYPLVNLRIESEMLMFIAQTGLNLQQAHTLRVEQFHYSSHLDGYRVRIYKNRREGEVLFEIFSSYRKWFNQYLEWRTAWFPDEPDGMLFPLTRSGGRIQEQAPQFRNVARICRELGILMIRPRILRGARINWLLRES